MPRHALVKTLSDAIARLGMPERGEGVVLAVSGGADSTALLHATALVNDDQRRGWELCVAHLNHLIRGEAADEDARFVEAESERLGLPCIIDRCDVPALARDGGLSLEQAARSARYAFLERVADERGGRYVVTAHHADDQVETVLINALTGTGLHGLRGMRPVRPLRSGSDVRLVRPLLGVRRDDLVAFLRNAGLSWRHDPTNDDVQHLRNTVRQALLPLLAREINPQVSAAILRLAEQSARVEAMLDGLVEPARSEVVLTEGPAESILSIDALVGLPVLVQGELLREAVMRLAEAEPGVADGVARELGLEQVDRVLELIRQDESGREVHLAGGIVAARAYERLVLRRGRPSAPGGVTEARTVACPGRTDLSSAGWRLHTTIRGRHGDDARPSDRQEAGLSERVDYDAVALPLFVRPPLPGDAFRPLGAPGSKKVSRYFMDAKIPREQRDRALLVCDQAGPIWLIGHRIDHRVRLTSETRRVLDMRAEMV